MCGIVGVKGRSTLVAREQFERMRDTFEYRGPDDAGAWYSGENNLALGHRRLSIIDPSPSGHQPMLDEDTGNVVVFNGEIYNYLEIRRSLETRGFVFLTESDTEVLLKAYAAYGPSCVDHFNGMFAFALWDASNRHLFLARDRVGKKPLYYFNSDNEFVFASEVKGIKAYAGNLGINDRNIDHYMSFGYVPGEETLYSGVKRLPPGCSAIYKDGRLQVREYWDVTFHQGADKGFDYYLEEARALLLDSIKLRLRSDVPLGIFLSGGIDSSAVVGLLADKVQEPLKTFSVAYDFGEKFNETPYAKMVAKRFETEHREIFVRPEQFRDFVPHYVHLMDEPVTEAAAISLYFVSKLAQEHVTVVLSGEGSDEIFAGYDLYRYMFFMENMRRLGGAALTGAIGRWIASLQLHPKLTKYATLLSLPLEERYRGISTYDVSLKNSLYTNDYAASIRGCPSDATGDFIARLFGKSRDTDALSRMLYFDLKTWLVDDLLIKADRMSMAASLELRTPFLDYRLVEFAAGIPNKYKIASRQGKYLLKKMMEGLLPTEIIYRKKMGFPTPVATMLRGSMREYADDTLNATSAKIHSYLNKDAVARLLGQHVAGKADHHRVLWQLLVLEEWLAQNG